MTVDCSSGYIHATTTTPPIHQLPAHQRRGSSQELRIQERIVTKAEQESTKVISTAFVLDSSKAHARVDGLHAFAPVFIYALVSCLADNFSYRLVRQRRRTSVFHWLGVVLLSSLLSRHAHDITLIILINRALVLTCRERASLVRLPAHAMALSGCARAAARGPAVTTKTSYARSSGGRAARFINANRTTPHSQRLHQLYSKGRPEERKRSARRSEYEQSL